MTSAKSVMKSPKSRLNRIVKLVAVVVPIVTLTFAVVSFFKRSSLDAPAGQIVTATQEAVGSIKQLASSVAAIADAIPRFGRALDRIADRSGPQQVAGATSSAPVVDGNPPIHDIPAPVSVSAAMPPTSGAKVPTTSGIAETQPPGAAPRSTPAVDNIPAADTPSVQPIDAPPKATVRRVVFEPAQSDRLERRAVQILRDRISPAIARVAQDGPADVEIVLTVLADDPVREPYIRGLYVWHEQRVTLRYDWWNVRDHKLEFSEQIFGVGEDREAYKASDIALDVAAEEACKRLAHLLQ